jgi:KaiC/GvpD/RAD55 family RecA-like ATPase
LTPELSIVKLFLNYNIWETYKDQIGLKDLPKELHPIFSVVDNYHNNNENKADLTVADLANLLVASSPRDKDYYLGVLEQVQKLEVSADTTVTLIRTILRNKRLGEISLAAHDAKEGRMDIEKITDLLNQFRLAEEQPEQEESEEDIFATDDLSVLVESQLQKPGLRWRLKTLNEMLGSLRVGDFGFVFARPETGKTTFLASEVTFMAEQLSVEDGPILWINNEEQSEKVMIRCIQASTEASLPELYSNLTVFDQAFKQKTRGKLKIIKDVAVIHKSTVEKLCRRLQPSLIIFDQIDKIVGFDNDREDLKLGAIYQWARELAKQFAPVIAICQADATGEGVKWLTMNNVANAKTSKQAEADWILGIGKLNDPGWENVRFLHLSKNKLLGDSDTIPEQRHGRREVLIDPLKARYRDIE